MKKSIRLITLILALVFMISGAALVVCHAVDEPIGGDEMPVENGGGVENGGNVGGNDGGEISDNPDIGGDNNGVSGVDVDNGQSGNDGGGNVIDSDSDADGNSDNSNQGYYYDPDTNGDNSNYNYNISDNGDTAVSSVTPNTTLYNSSGMSAAEAAPNEWSEITLDEKTVRTGVTDFSQIQDDPETAEDNSLPLLNYILLLRYLLLFLSLSGIVFVIVDFIISKSNYNEALRRAERSDRRRNHASPPAGERRTEGRYRSGVSDEDIVRTRRTSSRADTGEVYVPRRVAKKSR